jgi:hypothetical protein
VTATWTFGNEAIFYNNNGQADATISSGGTNGFILPDGSVVSSLVLKAGQLAHCIANVNGTNSLYIYVVTLNAAKTGTATLVGGTVTVADTKITANSVIRLSSKTRSGTPGALFVSAAVVGTSFTISSTSSSDTSTVYYEIVTY